MHVDLWPIVGAFYGRLAMPDSRVHSARRVFSSHGSNQVAKIAGAGSHLSDAGGLPVKGRPSIRGANLPLLCSGTFGFVKGMSCGILAKSQQALSGRARGVAADFETAAVHCRRCAYR